MAVAAILDNFEMAISPQRLTIYLYSTHRAVIFAIAQLSCTTYSLCEIRTQVPITGASNTQGYENCTIS